MKTHFSLVPEVDNYCVMGNPISHSKSPVIHQAFATQFGQSISYQSILVEQGGFNEALEKFQQLGGKGLNVTVPFKGDAWQSVNQCSKRAQQAEAANTIWFSSDGIRHGDTTDGTGLIRDFINHGVALKNKSILVIGAGGAVRGVLGDIIEEEPAKVVLVNRTVAKGNELIKKIDAYSCIENREFNQLAGNFFDIIINGTSASLSDELPPLPDDILNKNACCYDMVYGEKDTVFVEWAKKQGVTLAFDGLGMLVEQAAESFYIWRGLRPDTKPVIEMLRKR